MSAHVKYTATIQKPPDRRTIAQQGIIGVGPDVEWRTIPLLVHRSFLLEHPQNWHAEIDFRPSVWGSNESTPFSQLLNALSDPLHNIHTSTQFKNDNWFCPFTF